MAVQLSRFLCAIQNESLKARFVKRNQRYIECAISIPSFLKDRQTDRQRYREKQRETETERERDRERERGRRRAEGKRKRARGRQRKEGGRGVGGRKREGAND